MMAGKNLEHFGSFRPILLQGHERSLTHCLYNRDGDLLFTCSKDNRPTLWYADNGERVGTYDGHNGTVWGCDVTHDSTLLLTASADMSCKLWNVETGDELWHLATPGPCRWVQWSEGAQRFLLIVDPFRHQPAKIMIFDMPPEGPSALGQQPTLQFDLAAAGLATGARVIRARWLPLNNEILFGCEDGSLRVVNARTGEQSACHTPHTDQIQDIQFNKDKTLFITASKDNNSKVFDATTFECLTTFETDRPVNSAIIHPKKLHVITGGGQDAMSVTTTAGQSGKFEARFFHIVFGNLFALVKGHFGPINSLAIHPEGTSFVSGGEDGFVRVQHFDEKYLGMRDDVDDSELKQLEKELAESKGAEESKGNRGAASKRA